MVNCGAIIALVAGTALVEGITTYQKTGRGDLAVKEVLDYVDKSNVGEIVVKCYNRKNNCGC